MKTKDLIKKLKGFNQEAEVFVSSDEELNTLFQSFEIAELDNEKQIVIFGLSGSELE